VRLTIAYDDHTLHIIKRMLSARLKNNFSIVPLNEQWLEIIIKADAAGIGI
jgi:hypothetical protein